MEEEAQCEGRKPPLPTVLIQTTAHGVRVNWLDCGLSEAVELLSIALISLTQDRDEVSVAEKVD